MRALFLCLLPVLATSLRAQPAPVTRELRTIDFEERRLHNPEDLPMYWRKVEGPSLPHYVNGRLSSDRAHSGEYSFRFDLDGGGVIYRYPGGLLPVQRGAHYRVEGYVQTTPLTHARARITAYLVDQDHRPIPTTMRHSELYAASAEPSEWKRLGVELTAQDPAARWLIVELCLVQPAHYADQSLGPRTLLVQDVRGTAWFDDITISQVPRVHLRTGRAGNTFRRSDPLCLDVVVNDRSLDDLAAQITVVDAAGTLVYQRSGALDVTSAQDVAPGEKKMMLPLPELPAGWYSASLLMTSQGQFLGKQTVDLIQLADDAPPRRPDARFGVVATHMPVSGWVDLPEILATLGAGRVNLPVWVEGGDLNQPNSEPFNTLLQDLSERGIEPTGCLLGLPVQLQAKLRGSGWSTLLDAKREDWQPELAYLVARHANHLRRWQLGVDGSDAFVNDPRMRHVYQLLLKEFSQLLGSPALAMPWPAWYELDGDIPSAVALHIKPDILPEQVPLYAQELRDRPGQQMSIFLEPLDRATYGRDVQIRDLAQRVVYALSSQAQRIDLWLPVAGSDTAAAEPGANCQPQELYLVIRTLMTVLGGAEYRGKVPLAEGIEAFLFDRDGTGILAIWDRGAGTGLRPLAINLRSGATRVDLWGNVTPLLRSTEDRTAGGVRVEIGQTPVFLVGVDGELAQLRASVEFDNPLLESSFKPHTRKLRFTNPYRHAISGSFKLIAPKGWVLNPPTWNFSVNPGETLEREISIEFPYNSFAGSKAIEAQFHVQAEENSSFTVPVMLKLGLSDVGLQTLALRDGDDVLVQQMITNYGARPIDYTAFALYPGLARQERLVTDLAPGRTTVKKYRFTGVKGAAGATVRSGLRELNGTRILNDEVAIQ